MQELVLIQVNCSILFIIANRHNKDEKLYMET